VGNNGKNGILIEDFINFMIYVFILDESKIININFSRRVVSTIEIFDKIKTELKETHHNEHVKNLYDCFKNIHEKFIIIETNKYVKNENLRGYIDIVCEKCLIDIKVVKKIDATLRRKYFLQLILYYCAYNNPKIEQLGIYDYYRGNIYWINTIQINIQKIIDIIKTLILNKYTDNIS